jgi:hypothetical protein
MVRARGDGSTRHVSRTCSEMPMNRVWLIDSLDAHV